MFSSKKGFIMDPMSFVKGIIIGFVIGVLLVYLGAKNIIPLPFL